MFEPPEVIFHPGLVVKEEFFDYKSMQQGALNYLILSKFRLGSGDFYGLHSGIQLNNMQIGYADRYEGIMQDGVTPKDCLTIGVVKACDGMVTINHFHKMVEGDLVIIDDSAPYHFTASQGAVIVLISIRKRVVKTLLPELFDKQNIVFQDSNRQLAEMVDHLWNEVLTSGEQALSPEEIDTIEYKVLQTVQQTYMSLKKVDNAMSQAEIKAIEVKRYILDNLEKELSIQSLTQQFGLSDKTLETTFKTLFGVTPKQLIRKLKLNRAHEALYHADPHTVNVSEVAMQWGFNNFGRFSAYHKEVFGTSPHEILNLQNR